MINDYYEVGVSEEARGKMEREVVRSVRALHMHGVAHTDVGRANVLWNGPRPALAPMVPKIARCVRDMGIKPAGQPNSTKDLTRFLQDDILAATMI